MKIRKNQIAAPHAPEGKCNRLNAVSFCAVPLQKKQIASVRLSLIHT